MNYFKQLIKKQNNNASLKKSKVKQIMNTNQHVCENCGMTYDSINALNKHKTKFCINSKYNNLDSLDQQFKSVSHNKDISLYGRNSLVNQPNIKLPNEDRDLDGEYRQLLKQISDTQNKRNELQYQKQKAFNQLQELDKIEADLLVEKKKGQLQSVIQRREQLKKQQSQLQKQLQEYNQKRKQYDKNIDKNDNQHLQFNQGRHAGKLNMERKMLEDKLHQIQVNLNGKKREYDQIKNQMHKSKAVYQPIYIQKQKIEYNPPVINRSFIPTYNAASVVQQAPKQAFKTQKPKEYAKSSHNSRADSNIFRKASQRSLNEHPMQKSYNNSQSSYVAYMQPGQFDLHGKTLIQKVNPKGKSQEDLLIQSLIAQQYDDLKILSQIPKDSQLYKIKLKHFQQTSKIRTQIKQKAHQKKVNKMKRQFENQKIAQDLQRQNSLWVDQNRKQMLGKQTEFISGQGNNQKPQHRQRQPQIKPQQNNKNAKLSKLQSAKNMKSNQNVNIASVSDRVKQRKKQLEMKSRKQINQQLMDGRHEKQSIPYYENYQNQKTKDDNLWGYKISLLNLKNYRRSKPIKFKLMVFQDDVSSKALKQQYGTTYHDARARPQYDPFNPTVNNKLDQEGKIVYDQTFIVRKNLQALHNRTQNQIYVVFILAQKDQAKITNEPAPYAWYCFKITHFARIRQGRYTLNLYADQINYPSDMNRMKKKLQEQIQIELEQIVLENIPSKQRIPQKVDDNTQVTRNQPRQIGTQMQITQPRDTATQVSRRSQQIVKPQSQHTQKSALSNPKIKTTKQFGKLMQINESYRELPQQEIQKAQVGKGHYISRQQPYQFFNTKKDEPKNFDVIIKQARTLPSYIGPIKLQISFVDITETKVVPSEEILAELGNDLCNPQINYTKQFRDDNLLTPSTCIFIRILAISAVDFEPYMLGFSCINMFYDRNAKPITDNKTNQFMISQGLLQIPIFWGSTSPKYFNMRQIIDQYPILPGCSLLLGLVRNKSAVSNPLPSYQQGVYNTTLFRLDQLETRLIDYQYKRQPVDTNKIVQGYLYYKGIRKDYSGEQARKYIEKTLSFPKNNPELLNVNFMAEYTPVFGIFFCIDRLNIPKGFGQYYYFITVCLSPPANYYHRQNFDLNIAIGIDIKKSSNTELIYTDSQFYFSPQYNENTCLIVEVNRMKIINSEDFSDDLIQSVSHIIIPVFDLKTQIISVNVMQTTMPMLDGDLDLNHMKQIDQSLTKYIENNNKAKVSQISFNFRLLNGYFPNQMKPQIPKVTKKNFASYLPKDRTFKDIKSNAVRLINDNYNINLV